MNDEYLKKACELVEDRELLVNFAARRAKELARGAHPLVNVDRNHRTNYLDIALQEIAEGKIVYELDEE